MNILAVSHEYPPLGGGGANAAYNLLNGFVNRGHKVTLVTSRFEGLPEVETKGNLKIIRVNVKRDRKESCSFMEMADFVDKAYGISKRLVNEEKPRRFDICFVFFGIPSGSIGYMLKKRYKIPYIIRFGGGDIPGFQKRFTRVYKILSPAIKAIWKSADARVANSEGLRQMAYDFSDKYIFDVIPNGVDTEVFRPSTNVKTENNVNILFVSRLIERKGLQHIIPLLKNIQQESNKKVCLTVVGDGPYKDKLERLIAEKQVSNMVMFEGVKKGQELVEQYQKGDIFILPSSNEGMPNVVLEAMSSGLPVIMTPCQGSRELICNNGYISTVNEFYDKLMILVMDDKLRKRFGENGRNLAIEKFSWANSTESYLECMRRIVGQRDDIKVI